MPGAPWHHWVRISCVRPCRNGSSGDRRPVDQAVLDDRVPAQDVAETPSPSRERERAACEAVRRPDVPPLAAVEILHPEPVGGALSAQPVDGFVDVEPELASDRGSCRGCPTSAPAVRPRHSRRPARRAASGSPPTATDAAAPAGHRPRPSRDCARHCVVEVGRRHGRVLEVRDVVPLQLDQAGGAQAAERIHDSRAAHVERAQPIGLAVERMVGPAVVERRLGFSDDRRGSRPERAPRPTARRPEPRASRARTASPGQSPGVRCRRSRRASSDARPRPTPATVARST